MGAEEQYWARERTFPAFLCLSDAARRSAALLLGATRQERGKGLETLGLGGVEGLISTDGKEEGKCEKRN